MLLFMWYTIYSVTDRDTSGETVVDVKRKPTTATDYAGSELRVL